MTNQHALLVCWHLGTWGAPNLKRRVQCKRQGPGVTKKCPWWWVSDNKWEDVFNAGNAGPGESEILYGPARP